MPNHKFFSAKLSSSESVKNNTFDSQSIVTSIVSIGNTYKPLTVLGLAFSLGGAGILFPDWQQPAVAIDLKTQNEHPSNVRQQPLFNVIEQFKTRLLPPLIKEKQSTFAQPPILTTPKTNFNSLGGTAPIDFVLNSDFQPSSIAQVPSLGKNQKSNGQPAKKIYTVKPGDSLSKIARQHNTSIEELLTINKIENPNLISIGRDLNIPQIKSSQANTTATVLSSTLFISDRILEPLRPSDSQNKPHLVKSSVTIASQTADVPVDSNLQTLVTSFNSNSTRGVTDNPYVARLRADIEKLRDRYQTQIQSDYPSDRASSIQPTASLRNNRNFSLRSSSTLDSTANSKAIQSETSLESNPKLPVTKEFISVAPLDTSNYQPALPNNIETTTATIIQPQLPPLSTPDEYLPTVFNGYNWPAQGTLTSGYGWRWGRMHKGIDIAAPIGTPILAAAPGEVIFSGWNSGGYGNLIKIKHPDSSITLYAHNNRNMVSKGQQIRQGQQIAEMGSTGYSTGPHLHFEIRPNGNSAVNPMAFLNKK